MYRATLNGETFFSQMSTEESFALLTATLERTAGRAGSFSFSLAADNEAYGKFKKLKSYVDVYRDDDQNPLWSGRVIDEGAPFLPMQEIACEGLKAVLNDTQFRPITFNGSLAELVQTIIESHNVQVADADPEKIITVRTIEPEDNYLSRMYENISSTQERLDDLVDSYGGYMEVSKEGGVLYLDWFEAHSGTSTQTIDFGENLLNIRQDSSADGIITRIIPFGAEVEDEAGNRSRITIADVNAGIDYLDSTEGIEEFGIICAVETWDDVTIPANLKSKAQVYLADHARSRISVKIEAVDLADIGEAVDHFSLRQKIRVRSAAHNIDTEMMVLQQSLDLLNPDQNRLTLDEDRVGYISRERQKQKANTTVIERIDANYVTNEWMSTIRNKITEEIRSRISQESERVLIEVDERIAAGVENGTEKITEKISAIETGLDGVKLFVSENGQKLGYLYLEQGTGILWIGRDGDPIRLAETNTSIKFVDSAHNIDLLTIDPEGIRTQAIKAGKQIVLTTGDYQEWALRLGSPDNDGNHNFDILYVGNQ